MLVLAGLRFFSDWMYFTVVHEIQHIDQYRRPSLFFPPKSEPRVPSALQIV